MSEVVPEGWELKNLSTIATLEYGKSPNTVRNTEGVYDIVGTSGFVGKADEYLWDKESVVIGRKGTINKPIHISEPFWAIDTTYFSKFPNTTIPKWFYYQICHERLENYNEASGVPSLSRETLNSISILTPPLPEQKKIASILTSVDEVIEKTQSQIDKLQDLKKGTMNELLTKGIGHTEFKDSELGRIPKSWEVFAAGSLLENKYILVLKDGNHGAQYPRQSEFQKRGIPFLSASNIYEDGSFILEECPCLSEERAANLRIPPARGGDVILTHNATVGRVSLIPDDVKTIIASTSTTYYRTNNQKLNNRFLRRFFEGLPFQNQLKRVMGQTTRNQVPITAQKDLFIAVPPLEEQVNLTTAIDGTVALLSAKTKKLQQTQYLKKSLMQDLLTGKVRV